MFFGNKNKIAIYTAIFGGRDTLINPGHKIKNADLFCFTDNPSNKNKYFKTIIRKPTHRDPNRSAKKYKVLGDKILDKYEYLIWVDGNMIIKFDDAEKVVQECLPTKEHYIAFMKHPDGRNCIYEEYEFIKSNNYNERFDKQIIMDNQIQKYRLENYPKHNGLIASGFIVKDNTSEDMHELMNAWWNEIENHSRRDQLSFNYIAWKSKKSYNVIDKVIWDNVFIRCTNHAK